MAKRTHSVEDSEFLRLLVESPQLERLAQHGLRLHSVVLESTDDEVDGLPTSSDSSAQVEALQAELDASPQRSLQQRAALGDVVAGIAHQSRNIMTGVLSFAQVAGKRNEAQALTTVLDKIESESRRCVELLNQVLVLARSRDASLHRHIQLCSMDTVLASALSLVEPRLIEQAIRYQLSAMPSSTKVHGDAEALRDVFVNLLQNAADVLPRGGQLYIRVSLHEEQLCIAVEDDGPGVAEELREKIFAASFTTKGAGRGTGLGLAVSQHVVIEHGGSITVDRSALGGARFSVVLPRAEAKA